MSVVEVRSLWITRKSIDGGFHFPELLVAWDEYGIDENYEGWREACDDALAACGDDVAQWRIIPLRVCREDVEAVFEGGPVDAEVVSE